MLMWLTGTLLIGWACSCGLQGHYCQAGPVHVAYRDIIDRLGLLMQRALAGDAELVANGVIDGEERGFLLLPSGLFQADRRQQAPLSADALLELMQQEGNYLTLTAVPVGSGQRIALDRDEDGLWDGDAASGVAAVSHYRMR